MYKVLKTLHPGEIGTHDILFRWRRRWPLHHATRAICYEVNLHVHGRFTAQIIQLSQTTEKIQPIPTPEGM
jgi:hypothetical protein